MTTALMNRVPKPLGDVVESLATALDEDDYESARAVLAPEIVYEIGDETLVGREAVVASYRSASEMAHELFDGVGYGHEIVAAVDEATFRIRYLDLLTAGGESHSHYAEQEITVDPELGVVRIVHIPLPGEREKVDAFMARHNISRPS